MPGVIVVVDRVGFSLPNDTTIDHVRRASQTDLNQLAFRQLEKIRVG